MVEEVYEEEDDEDMDEICGTRSRFPAGFHALPGTAGRGGGACSLRM